MVTGYGIFTAFGLGGETTLANVFGGVPGFRPVTRFDTGRYRGSHAAVADVADGQLSTNVRCVEAALAMAHIDGNRDGAVLLGTAGDFTEISRFWDHRRDGRPPEGPERLPESVPAAQVAAVAEHVGVRGRQVAFSNACVAGSSAIAYGAELIATGRVDFALCGGSYLVEEEAFGKFDVGRAFDPSGVVRPFSAERAGMLLGDGVAWLVLESAERIRGRRVLARLSGWGQSSDAYHVCRPHPAGNGVAAALKDALRRAARSPMELDYINAHGTGTSFNDVAETRAFKRVLGDGAAAVPISSTKSTTGHSLDAAGAVEAVICLIALLENCLPPTAGFRRPDPECDLDYVPNVARDGRLHVVASTNAAFGGLNSALVLERP